jgi:hypothetical protein
MKLAGGFHVQAHGADRSMMLTVAARKRWCVQCSICEGDTSTVYIFPAGNACLLLVEASWFLVNTVSAITSKIAYGGDLGWAGASCW